jgi:hypothetical protein
MPNHAIVEGASHGDFKPSTMRAISPQKQIEDLATN